jgi:hypothetical protein
VNKQQVFNKVVDGLLAQNAKSYSASRLICMYRQNSKADDPCRCAFGHLIPDELYQPGMEANGLDLALKLSPHIAEIWGIDTEADHEDMLFLRELQRIHDSVAVPSWPAAFKFFTVVWALMEPLSLEVALRSATKEINYSRDS